MKQTSNVQFNPEIWSQKVLSKFYNRMWSFDKLFEPVPHFVRGLTAQIKKLFEEGLTPEQIAEKIDPEMFESGWGMESGSIDSVKFGHIENFTLYRS